MLTRMALKIITIPRPIRVATIITTTIAGNRGAVYMFDGDLRLTHVTVTDNGDGVSHASLAAKAEGQ